MVNDIPSANALITAILNLVSTLCVLGLVSRFFMFQRDILDEVRRLREAVETADKNRREEYESMTAEG